MRFSGAAVSVALAALVAAEGASDAPSDVLSLTAADFDKSIGAEALMLVEFYAPWCGHCKALAPHYDEASVVLKEKGIKLAKVDCVAEVELCQTHGVQGYPTLKVSRHGEFTEYNGPRKADGIISYMTKQSLPAVSEVTAANHEEFIAADRIVAIAYLPSTSTAPAPAFSQAAEKHRDDFLFGLVTDKSAVPEGVTVPSIVVYRQFDEPSTVFPYPIADATHEEIGNWVKELSVPIVDQVGAENYATYAVSGKPLAYLFLDPTDANHDAHISMMRPVAEKFRGKVNFVWIDAIKFGDHAKALNLQEVKWPSFVIQDLEKQLKYPLDQSEAPTAASIEKLAEAYVAGKLEPSLKSQPIPESQDEPVYNLVGKEFDQVVFDDSKDVFVEFYATWCGHCKRLKPIWDQLGEHFQASSGVTIAKMEATENDLPPSLPFRVSGFPTIKFKPAGTREFIDYDGDRSLESMISFVEENAKTKLVAGKQNETKEPAHEHAHGHTHEEL